MDTVSKETNIVIKQRSTAACIKEGFRLISTQLKNLLYSSWLPVLLTALFMSLYFLLFIEVMVIPMPADVGLGTLVMMYIFYVLYSLCGILLTGRLFLLFRDYRDTGRIPRLRPMQGMKDTLRMAGRAFLFQIWIILLAAPGTQLFKILLKWIPRPESLTSMSFLIAGLVVVGIIAIISLIPLVHTFYKYVLDGGSFLKMIGKSYGRGARHRGKIISVAVLSGAIITVLLGFIMLPMIIVTSAFTQSVIGVLQGDDTGVPSYFPWLMRITYLVSMVIVLLVTIYCYCTMLYAYGSIDAQENDRENYMNQQELTNS